ncbi:capsular polysaccharide synthesis protein [Streptococcus mitis]|jgi:putative glycosyltransferase|uniref:capsular polysaccharide synthesis protein n=1 Tax=Streptococcus mitis TaxID=28037 RepID=UPI0039C3BC8E
MNKLRKALNYYQDISKKRAYFPNNVLNWQLLGKFLGQIPYVIGENNARKICEKRHKVTREFLEKEFYEFIINYEFNTCNQENSKIIWTLWMQGYENAPELVKSTIDSIRKFAELNNFQFILLEENTIEKYVVFPKLIKEKMDLGVIDYTKISDILRVSLLAKYGGTWVDATIYMKEEFDSSLLLQNYYTIKTGGIEDYSPNISNNRWKGFFLSGNSSLFSFTRDFFFEYYSRYDIAVDYLLIDYIFDIAYKYDEKIKNQMLELEKSNPNLFWLESHLGDEFDQKVWDNITETTKAFKTTYKLSGKIKSNKNNFYSKLIDGKL